MWRRQPEEKMRCSFCHKSENAVGKLISSPSDYPRAYICDECVAVCWSILEDEGRQKQQAPVELVSSRHRFQDFPQAAEFFDAVEEWINCEPESPEAAESLKKMRAFASQMRDFPNCGWIFTTREIK